MIVFPMKSCFLILWKGFLSSSFRVRQSAMLFLIFTVFFSMGKIFFFCRPFDNLTNFVAQYIAKTQGSRRVCQRGRAHFTWTATANCCQTCRRAGETSHHEGREREESSSCDAGETVFFFLLVSSSIFFLVFSSWCWAQCCRGRPPWNVSARSDVYIYSIYSLSLSLYIYIYIYIYPPSILSLMDQISLLSDIFLANLMGSGHQDPRAS